MIRNRLIGLWKYAAILIVAVFLQTVLAAHLPVLGVRADLFVIVVVLAALGAGSSNGLVFGFAVGLIADIVFFEPLGVRALMYLCAGYLVGRFVEEFGLASAWVVAALTGVVTLASQFAYGVLQVAMGSEGSLLDMLAAQMIPVAVLNGLLAAPLHVLLVRIGLVSRPQAPGPLFG